MAHRPRSRKTDWNNSTVLTGDAMAAVAERKTELEGDILVFGSRTLVNALNEHDLIDKYRLMVVPIVLGSGMRLFAHTPDTTTLDLVDTRSLENGVVILTYVPAKDSVA